MFNDDFNRSHKKMSHREPDLIEKLLLTLWGVGYIVLAIMSACICF